jgi:hypothetical protein
MITVQCTSSALAHYAGLNKQVIYTPVSCFNYTVVYIGSLQLNTYSSMLQLSFFNGQLQLLSHSFVASELLLPSIGIDNIKWLHVPAGAQ